MWLVPLALIGYAVMLLAAMVVTCRHRPGESKGSKKGTQVAIV